MNDRFLKIESRTGSEVHARCREQNTCTFHVIIAVRTDSETNTQVFGPLIDDKVYRPNRIDRQATGAAASIITKTDSEPDKPMMILTSTIDVNPHNLDIVAG